ncbi:MAG: PDZ domain-containing protein [Gemmataceae bacterium]|nr:PDZ domain-containing protein [Gemmataceae bacterium]
MKRLLCALALFGSLAASPPSFAQNRDPAQQFTRKNQKFVEAFKPVVAPATNSTVRIIVDGKDAAIGMIVGPDGWILTKANDLLGAVSVKLRDGKSYPAQIIGVHQPHDLAILKIEAADLKPIDFKEAGKTEVGSWVACAGPSEEPVAIGVVSVASRNILNKGPIPKADLSKSAYLGVALEPSDSGGAKVGQVVPNAPAQRAGLKENDVIVTFDGKKFEGPEGFMSLISGYKPGDQVVLAVRRGDEIIERKATLERRPTGDNRGDTQNRMGSELSSRRSGYPTIFQHDSVVKPSDCGGPIVDLEGRVIGINICRAGRTESWAVPAEIVKPLLADLMSGKLPPPKLDLSKVTPADRVIYAKGDVQQAEAAKKHADQKLEEARKNLQKAEADFRDAEAKAKEAKAKAAAKKTENKGPDKPELRSDPKKAEPKIPDPPKEKTSVDPSAAIESLTKAMSVRLALMDDVAAAKWQKKALASDPVRESLMIDDLVIQGKEMGLPEAMVRKFFEVQIDSARARQHVLLTQWKAGETPRKTDLDLVKDLRPRIDTINTAMLQSLAQLRPVMTEAVRDQLRRRTAQALGNEALADMTIDAIARR